MSNSPDERHLLMLNGTQIAIADVASFASGNPQYRQVDLASGTALSAPISAGKLPVIATFQWKVRKEAQATADH